MEDIPMESGACALIVLYEDNKPSFSRTKIIAKSFTFVVLVM